MKSNFQENYAYNAQKIFEIINAEKSKKQAYSEVYDIINHLEDSVRKKIPDDFIAFVKENMDTEYEVKIDYRKSINAQPLLNDTRIILAEMYQKYVMEK